MLRSLAALALGVTVSAVIYELIAAVRLRALQKRTKHVEVSAMPPVTILKPLAGVEAQLYENLCSFVDQEYPHVQVIFGVARAGDPAIEVAQRVIARFPNADVSLVIGDGTAGGNPKIANLSSMLASVKHELLVIGDADMRVDATYLRAVVCAFSDPSVGAVTSLYCGEPSGGLPSILGSMYINEQFTPSALVANLVEPLTYCFGSTMAVRRRVLDEIGGLDALRTHIDDDYRLGKLVSDRGYRVGLAPYVVRNIVYESSFRSVIAHEMRWSRTIRAARPLSYASLFITQPVLCASLFLAVTNGSRAACIAFVAAAASRMILADAARRAFPSSRTPLWAVPLRDVLTAVTWVGGFFARDLRWGDRIYTLEGDGRVATSRQ